jgi:hypothetical protein
LVMVMKNWSSDARQIVCERGFHWWFFQGRREYHRREWYDIGCS